REDECINHGNWTIGPTFQSWYLIKAYVLDGLCESGGLKRQKATGTRNLATGTRHRATGTRHLAPGTWHPAPKIQSAILKYLSVANNITDNTHIASAFP